MMLYEVSMRNIYALQNITLHLLIHFLILQIVENLWKTRPHLWKTIINKSKEE